MAQRKTGNNFKTMFAETNEQEQNIEDNFISNIIPEDCKNDLLPCDGSSSENNPCPPGYSLRCVEDCLPGYTLGCCPDDSIEYPPGTPGYGSCMPEIYSTSQFGYSHTFLVEINNRLWSTGYTSFDVINIFSKDGTVYKSFSLRDLNPPDYTSGNNIAGYVVVQVGDEVWIPSHHTKDVSIASEVNYAIYVYDLDGNYLRWFHTEPGYSDGSQLYTPIAEPYNGGMVMLYSNSLMGGAFNTGRLMILDGTGTLVKVIDLPERHYETIAVSGQYCFVGYSYRNEVIMVDLVSGNIVKELDKSTIPTTNGTELEFGLHIETLRSNGLPDILAVGSGERSNTHETRDENNYIVFYDTLGNLLYTFLPDSSFQVGLEQISVVRPFINGAWRFGNMLALPFPMTDATSTNGVDGKGKVYMMNLDTFQIENEVIGGSYPLPSYGDQLGILTYFDKNIMFLIGGRNNSPHYVRVCTINWNETNS